MKRNRFLRRVSALVLLCLLCAVPVAAMAYDHIDTHRDVRLTLHAKDGGAGLEGVRFDLYQVATVSKTAQYKLTPAFASSGVAFHGGMSAGEWKDAAERLADLAQYAAPYLTVLSDAEGSAGIPGGAGAGSVPRLNQGMYLVIGRKASIGNYVYAFAPFLVALPAAIDNLWDYDVDIQVKADREQVKSDLQVVKIWKDKGHRSTRTKSVTVDLLQDGAAVCSVVLNRENNWKHTFAGLDNRCTWTVKERRVPSGYRVSYDKDGTTLFVINTLVKPPKDDRLPQTGLLWWPVPLLACAGMILFVLGYIVSRREGGGWPGMVIGAVLVLGALGLLAYNAWQERAADQSAMFIVQQMRSEQVNGDKKPEDEPPVQEALVSVKAQAPLDETQQEDLQPAEPQQTALEAVPGDIALIPQQPAEAAQEEEKPAQDGGLPDFMRYPEIEMPEIQIDGRLYIGTLEIPSLGLALPVMSDWDYPSLKLAPCRYSGSAYAGNLVISAHNYAAHFGRIKQLQPGEAVYFMDANGNRFAYSVAALETLQPEQTQEMRESEYDLTLFTCTPGGAMRVTVRCCLDAVLLPNEQP